jgi:hypothetical protein
MPDRTPEQLGKETGEALGFAIANGLEPILMRLADAVAQLRGDQAQLRMKLDELGESHRLLRAEYEGHRAKYHRV